MIQKLAPFLSILTLFTLFFFGIQYFTIEHLKKAHHFFYSTWSVYLFLFLTTLLIYIFILFVYKTFPDKAGFAFMACSILKMMAAIVFLLPLIKSDEQSVLNDVLAFFIPYFLFLLLETLFVLKILNKQ